MPRGILHEPVNMHRNFLSRAAEFVGPEWVALAILVLIAPFCFLLQITHDAAWQMWIGRQLLHGANLYTDIIEINPPLWFWLAVPLAALSELTGISALHILIVTFLLATAVSILMIARLLPEKSQAQRFLILLMFVVVAVPPGNFGQREHFTLITTVPYVLLIANRDAATPVPRSLAVLVGIFAALGFALKPHFALVPIALELWLRRRLIRPETVAMVLCAALYSIAVLVIEPDYFTNAVPLTQRAYGEFGHFQPLMLIPTALPFLLAVFLPRPRESTASALLIASLIFYLAFVAQMKGFAYQAIPAMGLLALSLAASIPKLPKLQAALAFVIALFAISANLAPYRTPAWADVPNGSSYAALSVAPRAGWPLVEERGLQWPLSAMSLWMAPAVGDEIGGWVTKDLRCNPPTYLLVDDRQFDFSRLFPGILSHYRMIKVAESGKFMILDRPFRRPAGCRTIH